MPFAIRTGSYTRLVAKKPDYVDLTRDVLPKSAVMILPVEVWRRLRAIGVARTKRTLVVAMADPSDRKGLKELEIRTGLRIFASPASEQDILNALARSYDASR